jgi:hypothetical protein
MFRDAFATTVAAFCANAVDAAATATNAAAAFHVIAIFRYPQRVISRRIMARGLAAARAP